MINRKVYLSSMFVLFVIGQSWPVVFVTGQARKPGSYTISSLSTLVNAVFACDGPAPNGSLRHILLKRGNAVITDFDLYDLLLHGDKSKDTPLEAGDVIYFPPLGPEIAVVSTSRSIPQTPSWFRI